MNSGELLSCIVPSNFSSCLAQKRIEQKYLQVVGGDMMDTQHKAIVTLTPRNDESDFTRVITLKSPSDSIIIGRASKTASKGLVGLPENAWFSSPIMSREHAKLFMASDRAVHIQDFASTHGTFIGEQRLTPNKPAPLSDGDVVKFGTTVTSGPGIFVETFSVPSSGDEYEATDDEDIISPSRRTSLAQKHPVPPRKYLDSHNLSNGQGQRTASRDQSGSQKNPIALQSPPTADDDINDSSNDEDLDSIADGQGQQVIPIGESMANASMSTDTIPHTSQSPSLISSVDIFVASQNRRMGKDDHGSEKRHGDGNPTMDPASRSEAPEHEVNRATRPSPAHGSYEPQAMEDSFPNTKFDREYASSTSEDDLEDSDVDAASQAAVVGVGESVMPDITTRLAAPPLFTLTSAPISRLAFANHNDLQDSVDYPSYFGWSRASGSECSVPRPQPATHKICQPLSARWQCASNRARAPSPSDAALVRKASAGLAESYNPFFAAAQNGEPPGLSHLNDYTDSRPSAESKYGLPWADYLRHMPVEPLDTTYRHTMPSIPSQITDDWQAGQADNLERERSELGDYHQGPFSRDHESFHPAAETSSVAEPRPTSTPSQKQCIVKLKLDIDNALSHGDDLGDNGNVAFSDSKMDLAKPSKVDISNLVNPHTDKSCGLKRKSNQMSSDEQASDVRIPSPPPSIQAADQCQAEPCTSTDAAMAIQDLKLDDAQRIRSSELEEPARKKRKTSVVKAGTIGGLVSGICLGLAGAFAAFIAAIPAEVRDEALRETTKLL
ncbi:MAG: hypothetical protein LQ348_005603 [Seirophora lacunosa]|nr:MAG: hypothetical protein LQ348_005603 [Seirophora lacunosa]